MTNIATTKGQIVFNYEVFQCSGLDGSLGPRDTHFRVRITLGNDERILRAEAFLRAQRRGEYWFLRCVRDVLKSGGKVVEQTRNDVGASRWYEWQSDLGSPLKIAKMLLRRQLRLRTSLTFIGTPVIAAAALAKSCNTRGRSSNGEA